MLPDAAVSKNNPVTEWRGSGRRGVIGSRAANLALIRSGYKGPNKDLGKRQAGKGCPHWVDTCRTLKSSIISRAELGDLQKDAGCRNNVEWNVSNPFQKKNAHRAPL